MRLTRGEAWWLAQRRMGLTAVAMAADLHISEDRLRRWQHDREAAPMSSMGGVLGPALTPGEWCALQRRRRGWTLVRAARHIGISRQTLWKAEWGRTAGVVGVRRAYERLGPARPTTAAPVVVAGPEPLRPQKRSPRLLPIR